MLSGCPSQVTACPPPSAHRHNDRSPRQPRSRQRRAPEAVGGVRVAEGLPLRAGYTIFAFAAIASLMWSPNTTVLGLLWLTGAVGVWVGTEGVRFPRAAVAIGVATVAMMPAASRMVATPPAAARGASDTAAAVSVADAPRPPGYVSRAEFGDAWPLTVGEGVLECDQSRSALGAVVFSAGGRRYGVNGTAKSLGFPAIDPIWRSPIQKLDYPPLARIPEEQRRRIFASLVACQDAGTGTADDAACLARAGSTYKLPKSELTRVTTEGIPMAWHLSRRLGSVSVR